MKLLGHKRIEMTLRYTKITPSHLRHEYNKAIQTIEKQTSIFDIAISSNSFGFFLPSEIIRQLSSFLSKAAHISPRQKKNLLLKMNRLKENLNKITFSEKFKIDLMTKK